jgi:hypothetical protein
MSALVCVYVWIVKYDEDRWVVNYALSVSLVTSCVVVFHFTIFHYLNHVFIHSNSNTGHLLGSNNEIW